MPSKAISATQGNPINTTPIDSGRAILLMHG